MTDAYLDFLAAKIPQPERRGFEIAEGEVNPLLKPHQRDMVRWAVGLGRAALFASYGLGKTVVQLEILRLIHNRAIVQFSMPGELVFDPFGGLMTVPYCALKLGRRGLGIELNPDYWRDGVHYLRAAEREADAPTLFDLLEPAETAEAAQ